MTTPRSRRVPPIGYHVLDNTTAYFEGLILQDLPPIEDEEQDGDPE